MILIFKQCAWMILIFKQCTWMDSMNQCSDSNCDLKPGNACTYLPYWSYHTRYVWTANTLHTMLMHHNCGASTMLMHHNQLCWCTTPYYVDAPLCWCTTPYYVDAPQLYVALLCYIWPNIRFSLLPITNLVIMCKCHVIVFHYYLFPWTIDLCTKVGKNTSSGIPNDVSWF